MRFLPDLGKIPKEIQVVKLDLKDKKILWLIGKDARMPIQTISKKVQLSRDAVAYRIRKLEKEGVLYQAQTIIDVSKFGYGAYHLFLRLKNPTKETELKIIKKIRDLPYVRAILKFYGGFDFEVAVIAKNVQEFDAIVTDIISTVGNYLEDYELLALTKNFRSGAFPKSFLKDFEFNQPIIKKSDYTPDKKDMNILKNIRDNSNISLIDIGTKVNLSPDAVSYRLKKLKESVILGYARVIDYSSIGYQMYGLLLQISNLDTEKEKRLHDFFQRNNTILWAVKTVGRYNVLAYVCTLKEDDLHSTINEIRNLFPEEIKRYESLLAFAEYKYTYAPDCIFKNSQLEIF